MFNSGYYHTIPHSVEMQSFSDSSTKVNRKHLSETADNTPLLSTILTSWNNFKDICVGLFSAPADLSSNVDSIENTSTMIPGTRLSLSIKTVFEDGTKYLGELDSHGRRTGYGFSFFEEGGYYKGECVAGQMHGFGLRVFPNGDFYEGQFFENMMHGKGRQCMSDGTRYEGHYFKCKMQGLGKITYSNGTTLEGIFCKNRPFGLCRLTPLNGRVRKIRVWDITPKPSTVSHLN